MEVNPALPPATLTASNGPSIFRPSMADRPEPDGLIADVGGTAALTRHFAAGEKPAARHRLGVEHEKVLVLSGGRAPGYGDGISALLGKLSEEAGWTAVEEDGKVIALKRSSPAGMASVTLEPGGQFEVSDAPRKSAAEAAAVMHGHLRELSGPARELGLRFLGVGFRPFGTIDDVPWMPKGRYRVMRAYLPTRGALAHDMMKRTATVQVNLDYADQADCADKTRVAMGTSSLVTALWAASPLVNGQPSGYQSYRASCWLATDDDRCGLLPFVFDGQAEHFYDDYAAWALDVPMFFVYRGGHYLPAGGMTFRQFLDEGWRGERATMADWELHLSTLFPEVRLKQYLEMRGADAGPIDNVLALPAIYRGLLYDAEARAAAWQLVAGWTFEERQALRREVPQAGLRTKVRGEAIAGRCLELVAIAKEGLRRLAAEEDLALLDPIERIAETGRTAADAILEIHAETGGDPDRIADAIAIPLG